jgi:hypothetical protein
MIVFDLKCGASGHVFEAWFGSSADYESQQGRGLVQCPICGDAEVGKAVMAPRLAAKGNQSGGESRSVVSDVDAKEVLAKIAALQAKLLERSEHVGPRFATEARAMHLGDIEARPIHGRATRAEAERLLDEGVPVAPLPLPFPDPGEAN